MKKNKAGLEHTKKRTHRGRIWLWLFIVVLILAGATAWVLHDGGIVNWRNVVQRGMQPENVGPVIETVVDEQQNPNMEPVSEQVEEVVEIKPACTVVESLLLKEIVPDDSNEYFEQAFSAKVYTVLAKYGCPENATFFTDMAARKQAIADGLAALYEEEDSTVTAAEYLYSDEKICQTIEKRVSQNINSNAYLYYEFLNNAKTYAALYEYGCKDNKAAYMRASLRELGVAVALMPTDKMERDEIATVVEICKSLGVADIAHLMLQRLKARGYDMAFLLEMENIIHGIR